MKFTCEFSTFLAFITLTSLWSKMFEQKFTFTKKILDYTDFYLGFFKNHLNTWLFLVFQKKTARLPRELANQLQILRGISIFYSFVSKSVRCQENHCYQWLHFFNLVWQKILFLGSWTEWTAELLTRWFSSSYQIL